METYRGQVRNPADAIKLFEACRLGLLPRVQRRLSEKERQSIQSGSVFVWDEREAGMRRWTDGKSWSASRVSGSFLTYREMEGKRGGGNFVPAPRRVGGKTPDSGRGSDEDAEMDNDGPDGYRYKVDGLMKQSFSITTSTGQHLHLISYFARPHSSMAELPQPTTDPALRHIVPVKGMYPESAVHDSAPPMRGAPTSTPYMPQQMGGGPLPSAMGRAPYLYPQGYAPWPPSPMSTPPYNYPPSMYQSPLPLPASGHPGPYPHHPSQGQQLPPHLQHLLPPQQYDRPSSLSLSSSHEQIQRYHGQQLPQMSTLGYATHALNNAERHLSDASSSRSMSHLSHQQPSDTRLPPVQNPHAQPPLNGHHLQRTPSSHQQDEHQAAQNHSQSQRSPRLNGIDSPSHAHPEQRSKQSIPSISNIVHATEPSTVLAPITAPLPTPVAAPTVSAPAPPSPRPSSQDSASKQLQREETASDVPRRDSSPDTATQAQSSAEAPGTATASNVESADSTPPKPSPVGVADVAAPSSSASADDSTPETASTDANGTAAPGEAGGPQDIPHAKLVGQASIGQEDARAISILNNKFSI